LSQSCPGLEEEVGPADRPAADSQRKGRVEREEEEKREKEKERND